MVTFFERLLAIGRSSPVGLAALIGSNAIPLVGVIFFGWDVYTLLILYWIESGVIGVINFRKIQMAQGPPPAKPYWITINGMPADASADAISRFFVMHYGIFWLVHGVFVLTLSGFTNVGANTAGSGPMLVANVSIVGVIVGTIVMTISHLASYQLDFIGHQEYRHISPKAQMFQPSGRVIILHVTVILGAMLIAWVGQPVALVALLVVLKTILDVGLYLRNRSHAQLRAVVLS